MNKRADLAAGILRVPKELQECDALGNAVGNYGICYDKTALGESEMVCEMC